MQQALRRSSTRSSNRIVSQRRCYAAQDPTETSVRRVFTERQKLRGERIFSGIQPTGIPHLGNYLGALRQWKTLQDERTNPDPKLAKEHKLYFSIVDLHGLTGNQSREERTRMRKESFASLLAIGLDPKYSNIFVQSEIAFHSELMWILSTVASTGYLSRMTQWKSKLDLPEDASLGGYMATEKLKLGLFAYPVLQAADILLYNTTLVPVGEDQSQHVEFARQLARSFHSSYGSDLEPPIFSLPRAMISPAKRIMSLRDPTSKMSKSHPDPKSRILITDNEDDIKAKLKGAVTDSEDGITYDLERRPGVSNLVELLKHVTESNEDCSQIAKAHETMSKSAFKEMVASETIKCLDGVRDTFHEVMKPGNDLFETAVNDGLKHAKAVAGDTMSKVRRLLGLNDLKSAVRKGGRTSPSATGG